MGNSLLTREELPISLRTEKISKSFGYRHVLREISLEVKQGESLAIRGPNGSGKSTLARLLAGLLQPTRGRVLVELGEREVTQVERWRLGALAAPAINPYSHLTLAENISFVSSARGLVVSHKRIAELIEFVGLTDRREDLVGAFSSGMVQRTRLALAIALSPRLLFLDEPSQFLDDTGRDLVARVVQHQRQCGACVIATNDDTDASLADHVLHLDRQVFG